MCTEWDFPSDSAVKNLPVMQEMWVRSLGWEDPLEEGMETHSSIPAWSIPWSEDPGRLWSMGLQGVRHNWAHTHAYGMHLRLYLSNHTLAAS